MTIAHAPAPSRSSATAVISWGLINIPVSLYTATEGTSVSRKEYVDAGDGDYHKVGRKQYDQVTGDEVASADIVKLAESSTGTLVPLTNEEIEAVTGESDGTAPIVALLHVDQLLTEYYVEKYYQVRPKAEKKGGTAHERAFALLLASLDKRDQVALIRITLRNSVAKYAAVTSDGTLAILHYTDAVRQERPLPKPELAESELEMADKLLDAIGTDVPDMRDETASRIREYVDAKATTGEVTATAPEPKPVAGESLEDLLAASLDATTKKAS